MIDPINIYSNEFSKQLKVLKKITPERIFCKSENDILKFVPEAYSSFGLPFLHYRLEKDWQFSGIKNEGVSFIDINFGPGKVYWIIIHKQFINKLYKLVREFFLV